MTKWQKAEILFLIKNYNKIPGKVLAKKLNRTITSISHKADRLNLTRAPLNESVNWTKKEINFIKLNFKNTKYKQIAKYLNRTYSSVMSKVRQLHLRKAGNKIKPAGESGFNKIFQMYKINAASDNKKFNLTKAQFKNIIIRNCHYCNNKPKEYNPYLKTNGDRSAGLSRLNQETIDRAWINVNGVDRVNNDKGYAVHNCVPCCFDCNEMKNNRKVFDFLNHIERIFKHSKRKKRA